MGGFTGQPSGIGRGGFFGSGPSGPTPTITITAGTPGGPGPPVGYEQTFGGVPVYGSLTAGGTPSFVTPGAPFAIGDNVDNLHPTGFAVVVVGVFPQNAFTSVTPTNGPAAGTVLTTASAIFDDGGGCGPNTSWRWANVGMVVGQSYGFAFAPP